MNERVKDKDMTHLNLFSELFQRRPLQHNQRHFFLIILKIIWCVQECTWADNSTNHRSLMCTKYLAFRVWTQINLGHLLNLLATIILRDQLHKIRLKWMQIAMWVICMVQSSQYSRLTSHLNSLDIVISRLQLQIFPAHFASRSFCTINLKAPYIQ